LNVPAVIRDNTTLREVIVLDLSWPNSNCSIIDIDVANVGNYFSACVGIVVVGFVVITKVLMVDN
jgi:hypothetical protein